MKKVVAVILTLVMLMSVPVGALAEMGETPEEGTTTVESPTEPEGAEETPTETKEDEKKVETEYEKAVVEEHEEVVNTEKEYEDAIADYYESKEEEPIEEPVEEPIEEPVEEPIEEPVGDGVLKEYEDAVVEEHKEVVNTEKEYEDTVAVHYESKEKEEPTLPTEEPGEGKVKVVIEYINIENRDNLLPTVVKYYPVGEYEIVSPEVEGFKIHKPIVKFQVTEGTEELNVLVRYIEEKEEEEVPTDPEDDIVATVRIRINIEGEVVEGYERSVTRKEINKELTIAPPRIKGAYCEEEPQLITVTELGTEVEVFFNYKFEEDEEDNIPEGKALLIVKHVDFKTKEHLSPMRKEYIGVGEHEEKALNIPNYKIIGKDTRVINVVEKEVYVENFEYIYEEQPIDPEVKSYVNITCKTEQGEWLKEVRQDLKLGEYNIIPPNIEGYEVISKEPKTVTLTEENPTIEISFEYKKVGTEEPVKDLGKVEITYLTKDGEEVSPKETKEQEVGTKVTYEAKSIKGYINKGEKSIEVGITEKDQVVPVVFTYEAEAPTKDYGVVEVTYKDDKGKEISSKQEFKQEVGKTEVYKAKTIKGYDKVGDKEKKVKIAKKDEVIKIEFKYEEESKQVSNSGGGGGSSRRSKDKNKDKDKEEKEIKVDKNVKEIDEKRETIRKEMKNQIVGLESNDFVVVNLEDIKQQNSGSFTLNTKKVDSYEKSGLKHRYYKWVPNREIWVGMGTRVNNGVITSTETLKSGEKVRLLAVKAPKFQDVKADDWYGEELDKSLAFGVIEGFKESNGETTFKADKTLTNAEFCTMVARLFGATENEKGRVFKDLPVVQGTKGNTWFTPYTNALQNAGVLNKGMTEDQFNQGMTRIEAVKLLTNLSKKHGVKTINIGTKFGDMEGTNQEVLDILKGNPDGTFKPNNGLTRAEAVAMISRTLKELGL